MLGKERITRQTRWLIYLSVLVAAILVYVFWPKPHVGTSDLNTAYFQDQPLQLDPLHPPTIQPGERRALAALIYDLGLSDTAGVRTLIRAGNLVYGLGDHQQAMDLYQKARQLARQENQPDLAGIADSNILLVEQKDAAITDSP
jgi:hypothetical protein